MNAVFAGTRSSQSLVRVGPRLAFAQPCSRGLGLTTAVLIASAAVFGVAPARAQTLMELHELARVRDTNIQAAEADMRAAGLVTEQARALKRPSLNLDTRYGRQEQDTPYTQPTRSSAESHGVTLAARQTLFNRDADQQIQQAQLAVEVAAVTLKSAEQDLIVRVAQAWFDWQTAVRQLQFIGLSKASIELQRASARKSFEVGTATAMDERDAQARYDLVLSQEVAAVAQRDGALVALELLVGRTPLELRNPPPPATQFASNAPALDWWVQQTRNLEPRLQAARRAVDLAQIEVERARAGHLPTVTLSGSLQRQFQQLGFEYGATATVALPATVQSLRQQGWGVTQLVGVQLTVPLFSGHAIENRVKEKLQLHQKAQAQAEGADRNAELATRQAWLTLRSAMATTLALAAAESSSELALRATRRGFEAGLRNSVDLLNAQAQLLQTQRDLARAQSDTHMARLRLLRAAGLITPEDLRLEASASR